MKLIAAEVGNFGFGGFLYTSIDGGVSWTEREQSRVWMSVASSADGMRLIAVADGGSVYISTDAGVTWRAREAARSWSGVASSADGTKLVAVAQDGTLITSVLQNSTTAGTGGMMAGDKFESVELQYAGGGTFVVLSHEGMLDVQ